MNGAEKEEKKEKKADPAFDYGPYDIDSFLMIGQSNMCGRGDIGSVEPIEDKDLLMLRNGRWQKLSEPVNPDRGVFSGKYRSGVCLATSFAEEYHRATGRITGLIPCADGGTSLDAWQPGGTLYENAVFHARQAMKISNLRGILWHQGEADVKKPDRVADYRRRFLFMIDSLLSDLGVRVPVVIGELGQYLLSREGYGLVPELNGIFAKIAEEREDIALAPAGGLSCRHDILHFNGPSLRIFGRRYFEAYRGIPGALPEKAAEPAAPAAEQIPDATAAMPVTEGGCAVPKFMRGVAVLEPGVARVVDDIPVPDPGDYGCILKMSYCGYCNTTDTRIIDGVSTGDKGDLPYPIVIGHEGVATAVSVGRKVRYIKPGDRFLRPYTGDRYGKYYGNSGNMCEYNLGADRKAMLEDGIDPKLIPTDGRCRPLPDFISDVDAPVLIPLVECLSAVSNFGLGEGMKVLIYGAGPMGLGMASCLRLAGADVTLADVLPRRLAYASSRLGIGKTVCNDGTALTKILPPVYDAVLDMVGSTAVLNEGSFMLRPGGKLCAMGTLTKQDCRVDLAAMQNHTSVHILGYPYNKMAYYGKLLELVKDGSLRPSDFYSDVMPFTEIEKCIAMNRERNTVKVILSYD